MHAAAGVASVLSVGGLIGTYAAALVNPIDDPEMHKQVVEALGVGTEDKEEVLQNDGCLKYLREVSKCVNVMMCQRRFLSATTDVFCCSTAITQARRRMWLAEAGTSDAHRDFFLKRDLVPGLLFSMNPSTMDELKKHVADAEEVGKVFLPKPASETPAPAGPSKGKDFENFKQGFQCAW